jgi:hypothetical protein
MAKGQHFLERLWAKIDRRGPDECWPWTGVTNQQGYGRIQWCDKRILAHRAVFASTRFVDLSRAPMVIHSCDNPKCCNPRHLRAGDARANACDMVARGRDRNGGTWGEQHGRAGRRRTRGQLRNVRAHPPGWRGPEFQLVRSTVGALKCGQNWKRIRK